MAYHVVLVDLCSNTFTVISTTTSLAAYHLDKIVVGENTIPMLISLLQCPMTRVVDAIFDLFSSIGCVGGIRIVVNFDQLKL